MRTLESARGSYYEARIVSKSRYEPRLRATPRKRVVYEPRALSSVVRFDAAPTSNVDDRN